MRKNGNNDLNRGTKKSFVSFLPILGASLISAGALAGVGVSAWHVSQNYQKSSEFSHTVKATVEIDPVAFETDAGRKKDENLAKENTKIAAERLSAWLKQNGQENYDVNYALVAPGETGTQYFAKLTAQFKLDRITSKLSTDKEKVENDPYLSVFDTKGVNSNNKTFIYRWYDQAHKSSPDEANPIYSILDFNDLFVLPETVGQEINTKSMSDKDGKAGIVYEVNAEKNKDFLNNIYKDLLKYQADTKATNAEINVKVQPRVYIINNLDGFYNEVNYHILNLAYSYLEVGNKSWRDYLSLYQDSDYYKFAYDYVYNNWKGTKRSNPIRHVDSALVYKKDSITETESIPNADILNWIDTKTAGTVEHTTIFNKYVEDVIPAAKLLDKDKDGYIRENIDDKNLKNTIPATLDAQCDIKYFWHPYSSTTLSETYITNLVERSWKKSKIISVQYDSDLDVKVNYDKFTANYQTQQLPAKFTETIFGGNSLIGALAIGFLVYLVILGILLACLYRTTGVFSWICMMFMLSMTGLIAVFGSTMTISMSLLFGLFIMSIVGFITALGICGVMKRRLQSNEDTQVIVAKTFKKSLWPSADASIIALIFGICFTYIAPLGLNPLGLVLIIGGFANFIGTYLMNGGLHLLWFNNKITMHHYGWFGKEQNNAANEALAQGHNNVPNTLDATKLEFPYYSKFSEKKVDVTGKKAMIASIITGALVIAGIVLFAVLGFVSSSMFKGDEWTIGTTNKDILNFALISIIVATAASAVYIGIRCNWTSMIPMLAGSMLLPMLMLGIASASQIQFDETVVLGFAMITVINTVVCGSLVNSINCVWSRHEGYNKKELKFIVNTALKDNFLWLILLFSAYALFIIAFGVSSPIGCVHITGLLIIGLGITTFFAPFVIAYLLFVFLSIRNKALVRRANRKANKVVVNYDEIDEQSIEGMNKFTKRIPIPKKEEVENETK